MVCSRNKNNARTVPKTVFADEPPSRTNKQQPTSLRVINKVNQINLLQYFVRSDNLLKSVLRQYKYESYPAHYW